MIWIGLVVALALFALVWAGPGLRRWYRAITAERARELFVLQRERLERTFAELAQSAARARGEEWGIPKFGEEVSFARRVRSSEIIAFVDFDPNASRSDGASVENGSTAIFHYHQGQWGTSGRALIGMTRGEALSHFGSEYHSITFSSGE